MDKRPGKNKNQFSSVKIFASLRCTLFTLSLFRVVTLRGVDFSRATNQSIDMIATLSPRQLFLLLLTCGMISTGALCVAAQPKAYVTAARTELRLQETNSPTWVAYAQPRENQACVFLDPDK
ncbi:MAG: hypothetical protein ABS32_06765, partial [Verrucomicrobia subdivision 6 bacterium BACL9 MAG-120820-bin42]